MKENFSTLTFYLWEFEVTIVIWGATAVPVELLPPGTGVGEIATIMRRHHSIMDRLRTRYTGGRALAVANISPAFLNCRCVGRTAPDSGSARAMPLLRLVEERSPWLDRGGLNFQNLDDPLVRCIDAERAAI